MRAVLVLLLVAHGSVARAATEVNTCGQTFSGAGYLAGDLDCMGYPDAAITIDGGKLDLLGFTLTGGALDGVLCTGSCSIVSDPADGLITWLTSEAAADTTDATLSRIEIDSEQRVSITGEHPSLEALLEELAWQAGFELRSFGVDDRPVAASLDGVPVDDALRRLLGRDGFTLGVSVRPDGRTHVTWVEVPGPHEALGARRGRSKPRAPGEAPFQVPPKLFLAAFQSPDPAVRIRALETIEQRVLGSATERERFLATDAAMFVEALKEYPTAAATLRHMAARQTDGGLRRKLEEVIVAVEANAGTPTSRVAPSTTAGATNGRP